MNEDKCLHDFNENDCDICDMIENTEECGCGQWGGAVAELHDCD